MATVNVSREQLLEQRRQVEAIPGDGSRASAAVAEIDEALGRLDRGEYGLCDVCHEPVETNRLLANPLVRLCLDHLTEPQRRELELDLALAQQMQNALLPPRTPRLDGWDIAYAYRPAGVVSGDYVDVIPADDGAGLCLLGDVSGKGVAASLLMASLQATFRSLATAGLPLADMLARGNRMFLDSTVPSSYATLVGGWLHPGGRVDLFSAGHPPPLWRHGDGTVELIRATGLPFGLFTRTEHTPVSLQVAPGDVLVLYSDGVSDAESRDGSVFGTGPLETLLNRDGSGSASEIVERASGLLDAFGAGAPRIDDETLLVVKRMGDGG